MGTSTTPENIKAAKRAHRCSWCAERIEPGEQYVRYRWFDGDDAATVKQHPECHKAMIEEIEAQGDGEIEFAPGEYQRGTREAA